MKKNNAKKCALVAVDELIKIHYLLTATHDTSPSINYWKEVKKEIQNL
jgi:4-alpha-glucanotransferase